MDSIIQLVRLLKGFGLNGLDCREDVFNEFISLLPKVETDQPQENLTLTYTYDDNPNRSFHYGCDYQVKRFEEELFIRMPHDSKGRFLDKNFVKRL